MTSRPSLAALLAHALAPAILACGPGLEAVHESGVRFEHCYRLDMDPRIAPGHREHCWRDWSANYVEGQPLDRVEYARRRIAGIEAGRNVTLEVPRAPDSSARMFAEEVPHAAPAPMEAPAPTSANAPPPRTDPTAAPPPPPVPSARPGADCADGCASPYEICASLCAARQADCAKCREEYRGCMRRCYE